MKLGYFSIQDYRSITKAELQNLQTASILLGPNNEGKSNVLQGLNACLTMLRDGRTLPSKDGLRMRYTRDSYDWVSDFPVRKQEKNPSSPSVFELHFQLSDIEKGRFENAIKSKLNGVLPIELRFTPSFATFKVLKQGRGGATLSKKADAICRFIGETLDFAYIPAVRTARSSIEIVNDLVEREIRKLTNNAEYAELLQKIEILQKPVLDGIAERLKGNLKEFLGSAVKDVTLNTPSRYRGLSRSCQIVIDDGTPTLLERKGDGVQSLVAISLITGALQETGQDKDIIILLEEPESHLHPKAIHQLREVLNTLGQDNQLIVTTHSPVLANRVDVSSNLIVSKSRVTPAESLAQLREVLGVRTSDNLQHAALVIVVEGSEDEVALRALLTHRSIKLGKALSKGAIAFHALGGASKLPYGLSLLQTSLCNYYVVIDDDDEGRKGYAEAEKSLLASPANTTFTKCQGLPECEFEDLFSESVYADYFKSKYSVDVTRRPFDKKQKWSKRIRQGLNASGKSSSTGEAWPERDEYEDKSAIAEVVSKHPESAVHPAREDVLNSLVSVLEEKLDVLAQSPRA